MAIAGADPAAVRRVFRTEAPLSGLDGFAGELDGRLVRDVLGRYPVFSEPGDPTSWSSDPTDLAAPEPVPAGHVRDERGDRQVWTLPDPEPIADDDRAVSAVRSAVLEAVDAVRQPVPIAFSGGLDSSILAARLEGPLYVGGFEGSHDIAAARSAAAELGRDLHVVEFSHADIERAVPTVVEATGRSDPTDVRIALPLYLVAEAAAADGHDRLAVGQGADELFGGYAKVANAPESGRTAADTVRGAAREAVGTLPRQLERDVLTLRAAGVEPVAPLVADPVVEAALSLSGSLLISGGERKVALRRAADFLPESIRSREKKALQYGSLLSREFDRLARQAGFKRRMDDHLGQYVESLR
ncbi:asparagine synthetase B [Natronomonas sp. F2-12]|jgi:asparagine synthase (glutamine-hydrolysing)|uniref:Asparagine synthetase B n=1 Tax=Natronomonas aquatica TaxID=2841590 RepID=A0A9R1D6Y3_9EURY|nr:asparagine synthase-related protein [Natronomonas aquatica]MCQ4333757.1 asparagine synthetase B [Natronomonas aquatica]